MSKCAGEHAAPAFHNRSIQHFASSMTFCPLGLSHDLLHIRMGLGEKTAPV